MTEKDTYITKQEAARHFRVSVRTVDMLVRRGDLAAFRVGRRVLFRLSDLDELVARNPVEGSR